MNDWDWVGAEPQLKRALMLDPSDAGSHEAYAEYLLAMGRYSESLSQRQRSRELNPLWPAATVFIGDVYLWSRQYGRALEYYQQAIRMSPDFFFGYQGRGFVLFCQGRTEAAVPDYEKVVALADFPLSHALLGQIYGMTGKRTDALKILEQLKRQSIHQYVPAVAFVVVYEGLGDKDLAFQWLEKAYEDRSGYLASLRAPYWDGLRSDLRFHAIYKKVGLPP
jgi:tetratricopeptide (TPR) repeat protein